MSATLRVDGTVVALTGGRWVSTTGQWETLLNTLTPGEGVSPGEGNPEHWLAWRAAAWLTAHGVATEIVHVSESPARPGTVY